ncbi:Carboxypeptidase N subunit 2 [Pseudolycoriella hygida]|uniref:Carboxypeptidase N subunit 2 n=1 Tax=Pseudolycoriella hygida TaxID=35572 RepID=A0A9Q0N867_9DIPT|nr:Carboxypeptidase N subunit 2 [Pseudolycoriella hygida]
MFFIETTLQLHRKMSSLRTSTVFLVFAFLAFIHIKGKRAKHASCGRQTPSTNSMMNQTFDAGSWPWHAAIYYQKKYQCVATLISENSVVTSGHCVANDLPTEVEVRLGSSKFLESETAMQSFGVVKIFLHPNYDEETFNNDIAILRLSTYAVYNEFIQPICLWPSDQTNLSEFVGKDGTVIRWEITETNEPSMSLQEVSMRIISHMDCLGSDLRPYISTTNFCARLPNDTNISELNSGGSLIYRGNDELYYIRGIVSVAPIFNSTRHNALFTDVAQYLPWIEDMKNKCEKVARCEMFRYRCYITVTLNEPNCKIIFTTDFYNQNSAALVLSLNSMFQPDLSDAAVKFKHLKEVKIIVEFEEVLDRSTITPLKNIEFLSIVLPNGGEIPAHTFDDLTNLLKIKIQYNRFTDDGLFEKLLNLEEMVLSLSNLQTLPERLFKNNSKLKLIDLSYNRIKNLSEHLFEEQQNLEVLEINVNELSTLPENIFTNNPNLKEISLYRNNINNLPRLLFRNNTKLRKVFCAVNEITEIPEDLFKENRDLEILDIKSNKLTILPEHLFRNQAKLKKIVFSYNKIIEIPGDFLKENHDLEELYIGQNKLTMLPENLIKNNRKLHEISFESNNIREIPEDIFKENRDLEKIDFGLNKLTILPENLLRNNPKLREISFAANNIVEIPEDFFKGNRDLNTLYFSLNKLTTLPENLFINNQKLIGADFNSNNIVKIAINFQKIPNLHYLSLESNACINEYCHMINFCGTASLSEMQRKLRDKCPV